MMNESNGLKVLIHAPSETALVRARANAKNLLVADPSAVVKIVLNGPAVKPAVEGPVHEMDEHTWLCPNTMKNIDITLRTPLRELPFAAILALAKLQQDGWLYIRA